MKFNNRAIRSILWMCLLGFGITHILLLSQFSTIKNASERLSGYEQSYITQFDKIHDENEVLQREVEIFRQSTKYLPISFWLKDTTGIMIHISDKYVELHLKDCGLGYSDYVGYRDEKIWGKEIAEEFKITDDMVLKDLTIYDRTEWLPDSSGFFNVRKFPWFSSDGTLLGVAGIEIRCNDFITDDVFDLMK